MTIDTLIVPDWPAPSKVKAISTTRMGGVSQAPYNQLNLGTHVGDDPQLVLKNRALLTELAGLPEHPRWLEQVHGTTIIDSHNWHENIDADAIFSQHTNHVCPVMTADCLPLLFCTQQGDAVAAVHVGWRGLVAGIIETTLARFSCHPSEILAWLGPAIGPTKFEVGQDVYDAFTNKNADAKNAFLATGERRYHADIFKLASQQLHNIGVDKLFGGDFCTVSDKERFFSYRRDGVTGRMASMIWIADK